MNRKTGKYLMTAGLLLLAAALFLTGYNIWDEARADRSASAALEQLPQPKPAAVPDYLLHPEMEMPTVEIDGHRYIGRVTLPSLQLDLPVLAEWNSANGKIAPCRYRGSAYTDDLIIAGHNYRSHFGSLKYLSAGDPILFTDVNGTVFTYAVAAMEVLDGMAVEEMESGSWDLSLFTCTYGGQTRLTIRCLED